MSRLDSFIRRLTAQRACLDRAASLIADLPGPVLELGLGNGRSFDHLREILPDRDIFVFERTVAAHPDCVPPPGRLILGDLLETLPASRRRFAGSAALAHVDVANGDVEASHRLAMRVAGLLAPLLKPGAIVVSERPLAIPGWVALEPPESVTADRYRLYRATAAGSADG
jgi:hypothetical protein